MKIGVAMFITRRPVNVAPLARRCEELGFESLWVPEHPAIPVDAKTPFRDNISVFSVPLWLKYPG